MESDNFRKWVIAAHLVANQNFSDAAIRNEFLLIGIVFAIVFNLFHANAGHEKHIITNMKVIESRLQLIMGALAAYLSNQNNTFHSQPEYYIAYFEMRYNQCQVLHNLYYEMKKIRTVPVQAKLVAEYMLYLTDFVNEFNCPKKQIEKEKL